MNKTRLYFTTLPLVVILATLIFMPLSGCDSFGPYGGGFKSYIDPKRTFEVEIPKSYNFKEMVSDENLGNGFMITVRHYEALGKGKVTEFFVVVCERLYGIVRETMSVEEFQDLMAANLAENVFQEKEGKVISKSRIERAGVVTPTLKIKMKHLGKDYWGIVDVYTYGNDLFLYGVGSWSENIGSDKKAIYFLECFSIPD